MHRAKKYLILSTLNLLTISFGWVPSILRKGEGLSPFHTWLYKCETYSLQSPFFPKLKIPKCYQNGDKFFIALLLLLPLSSWPRASPPPCRDFSHSPNADLGTAEHGWSTGTWSKLLLLVATPRPCGMAGVAFCNSYTEPYTTVMFWHHKALLGLGC